MVWYLTRSFLQLSAITWIMLFLLPGNRVGLYAVITGTQIGIFAMATAAYLNHKQYSADQEYERRLREANRETEEI